MSEIARTQWTSQPWKNGRGITHEIVRWPEGDAYDVRVSLAEDTEAATFSLFPGYTRWSFLAAAAPISLVEANGPTVELVALGDHVRTAGVTQLMSILPAGPTQLLNVLVRTALVDTAQVVVGYGPSAHPVRFAFSLVTQRADQYAMAQRIDAHGCVWIA